MSDKIRENIARARRAALRKNYPTLAPFFTTAADKEEMETAEHGAREHATQAALNARQEDNHRKHMERKARIHQDYDAMEEALADLSRDLGDMMLREGDQYWRDLIFDKNIVCEIVWAENPLNKGHEDYLRCLEKEGPYSSDYRTRGYKDFGKDYKQRPFIHIKFNKYDAFSIGYDMEKRVYTYYALEPIASCTYGLGESRHHGTFNPRDSGTEPEDWFIRQKLQFKTPNEVLAQFETHLQETIGIAQAKVLKNIFNLAKTAPGSFTIRCFALCVGLFLPSRSKGFDAQSPEP